jgi:hypothetical protein
MSGHIGAPVSAVLELQSSVAGEALTEVLAAWLRRCHNIDLEPGEHQGLMVEWRTNEDPFACQLVVSDSRDQVRRTITVGCDEAGAVAFIDETPFAAADAPHASMDLSEPIRLLLGSLIPLSVTFKGLTRGVVTDLTSVDGADLATGLSQDFAPGLLVAVTSDDGVLTEPQEELFGDLTGLTIVGWVPVGSPLLAHFGVTGTTRAGCVVCIARSAASLDAEVIASTSLRTRLASARRLIVRRQLAAPVPFDLERRRSSAVSRLLAGGPEIDLPTALQLLDEETQRASDLGNRVKELELQLELAYDEQDSALGELDNSQSQVRYLQRAFKDLGEFPIVEVQDDDDWQPGSCVDALVAARESLPFLIISIDESTCNVLDAHQKSGIWAKKIWSSLRALNDYCRAKAEGTFSGNLSTYRANTPAGGIPLLAEYAATESKSTSDDLDLVAIRTFTVPSHVDPSGKTYMQQHVKIDKGGQSAPRIHLHDDSGGATQRIYVGYVGPHLPTSSNF